jgi:hypothetical protein
MPVENMRVLRYATRIGPRFAAILLGAVMLSSAAAAAPEFSKARTKINSIKPDISYSSFCSERPSGGDKVACRIASIPSVGFLVCKNADVDGVSCEDAVKIELASLAKTKKQGLKVIDFSAPELGEVQCAEERSQDCYGYLVGWVADGTFTNIDHAITEHKVAELAEDIVRTTTPRGLATTKKNIKAIATFMTAGSKYSRICDLQGFYLRPGGFLIADVPQIEIKQTTKPDCGPNYPTFDEEYKGILDLVERLKP